MSVDKMSVDDMSVDMDDEDTDSCNSEVPAIIRKGRPVRINR
jgi:hypothetical protein